MDFLRQMRFFKCLPVILVFSYIPLAAFSQESPFKPEPPRKLEEETFKTIAFERILNDRFGHSVKYIP